MLKTKRKFEKKENSKKKKKIRKNGKFEQTKSQTFEQVKKMKISANPNKKRKEMAIKFE